MYTRDLLLYAGLASSAFAGVLPRASVVSCKTPWVCAAVKIVKLVPASEGIKYCSSFVHKYATTTVTTTSTTSISTSTIYSNVIAIAPTPTVSTATTSITSVFTTETDTSTFYIDVAATAETPTNTAVTTKTNVKTSQVTDTLTISVTTFTTTFTVTTDGTTTTTTSVVKNTAKLQPTPNPAKRDIAERRVDLPIITATSSITNTEETTVPITTTTGTVTPDAVTTTQTASTDTTTTSITYTTTTNVASSTIVITSHVTATSVSQIIIPKVYTFNVVQQGRNCVYVGDAAPNNFYYAAFNSADVENCALRCVSNPTCVEFEYDHLNGSQPGLGICYLFNTLGNERDIFCATGTTSFDYYGMYKLVSGRP